MKPYVYLVVGLICAITALGVVLLERNLKAKEAATEKAIAASSAQQIAASRREVEAIEFTRRATQNLANWKDAFLGEEMVAVCYHGHIFDAKTMLYRITCDVGFKGYPPVIKVDCDQDRCTHQMVEKVPRSPHEPIDDGLHGR